MTASAPPSEIDDQGEAFARAVFGRFLRQATICRDVDDAIEHMHIVNDNSTTFDIRLGGEARVPVSRGLIFALATKKRELLGLCEAALRPPRPSGASHTGTDEVPAATAVAPAILPPPAVVYPPPTALEATREGADEPPTTAPPPTEQGETAAATAAPLSGAERTQATSAEEMQPPVTPEDRSVRSIPATPEDGPSTIFVRKIDNKMARDDVLAHFSKFGEVVSISMNPTRGYCFVDYASPDCVVRAVRATEHVVGHRRLEVEVKKDPPATSNSDGRWRIARR